MFVPLFFFDANSVILHIIRAMFYKNKIFLLDKNVALYLAIYPEYNTIFLAIKSEYKTMFLAKNNNNKTQYKPIFSKLSQAIKYEYNQILPSYKIKKQANIF